ncbi:MAG: DEAD/DEAH box helicase family protein [archaeon]|jgi:superfamily II DNA or RNA helicase
MVQSYLGPKLRKWQTEAISHWDEYNRGIIQAVPGSGKTFLAISSFCSKIDKNPNLRVLIVCPRLTLIKQWKDQITQNTTIKENEIYEISSKNEVQAFKKVQHKFDKNKVFISTFNQIKQFFLEKTWREHDWFLIVDEMHNTTEGFDFPDDQIKYKLGLSATPKKRNKTSTFNLGGIVYTYSFEQALHDKIILEPEFKLILYSVNKQLFEKILENENDLSDEVMNSAYDSFMQDDVVENTEENEDSPKRPQVEEGDFFTSKNVDYLGIQKILKQKFKVGEKNANQSLVFVNRIKKADLLNDMLINEFGPISHSYHSQVLEYNYNNHFENISKQFEERKFNVLISVSTLGEGIDFPYASHGILASPIHNPTAFVQKVGRLLRKYKDHEKAVIYYYVPSELISKLLSDPKISPNYLKAILKIADEHKNLYFVDRKTLKEERGSLADLLSQGSAYERNEDILKLKIPHKLDSVLRLFRRVYPKSFKHWKKYCNDEDDFSLLEQKIVERKDMASFVAKNLLRNISKVNKLQEIMVKESGYERVRLLVETAIRSNIITKIKYGEEIENYYLENKTKLDLAEQKMLIKSLKTEYASFRKQSIKTKKELTKIKRLIPFFKSEKKGEALDAMFELSKSFFALQSIFLDQLELERVAKNEEGEKFVLTIGKDLFVASAEIKSFAYPEEFGFSRWKTPPKQEEIVEIPKIEQFCLKLVEYFPEKVLTSKELEAIKHEIKTDLGFTFTNKEILEELETQKAHGKYSFSKTFFIVETLNQQK